MRGAGGEGGSTTGPPSLKLLYYLIATMNLVFPDYDFSELPPDAFRAEELPAVVAHVNTTLFNAGLNKNVSRFEEFSSRMWNCVDEAISLSDCKVYTYVNRDFDTLDDPFWERGCVYRQSARGRDPLILFLRDRSHLTFRWSFNYFFWNRKLKRIVLFTCRAVR